MVKRLFTADVLDDLGGDGVHVFDPRASDRASLRLDYVFVVFVLNLHDSHKADVGKLLQAVANHFATRTNVVLLAHSEAHSLPVVVTQ